MGGQRHFDRLDQSGDAAHKGQDRFEAFKINVELQRQYREAYEAAARQNPDAVKGLPHPDNPGPDFDPARALELLRGGRLLTDPPAGVQT